MSKPAGKKELIGYGVADAGQALIGTLIGFYQLYFFTDVMLIPAASLAGVFLVTKILDSVSFPFFGIIIDRFSGKIGGYRSWLAYSIVPFFLISILIFTFNPSWGQTGRLVYAYVIVSLFFIISSLVSVAYSGLISAIADSANTRANLSTTRFIFAFGSSTVAMFSIGYLVDLFGGKENNGYFGVAVVFSSIACILLYVTYKSTTERIHTSVARDIPPWHEILKLFRTKVFLAAFFASLFIGIFVAIKSQMTLYYITYVLQRTDLTGWIMAGGMVSSALGVCIVGFYINIINRKLLFTALMASSAAFIAAIYFIDVSNVKFIIACHFLNSALGGACAPILFSIYSDVVDYCDYSTRIRSPGLINSCAMMSGRIGGSFGLFLTPIGLALYNYMPNEAQSVESSHGILVMFTLVPAAFALVAALSMLFYRLTNSDSQNISEELLEAQTNKAASLA